MREELAEGNCERVKLIGRGEGRGVALVTCTLSGLCSLLSCWDAYAPSLVLTPLLRLLLSYCRWGRRVTAVCSFSLGLGGWWCVSVCLCPLLFSVSVF